MTQDRPGLVFAAVLALPMTVVPLSVFAAQGDICWNRSAVWGWENAKAVDVERCILAGADPNSHDNWGWTPLHATAGLGQLDTVRVLVDAGADLDAPDKAFGFTPLHAAVEQGQTEVVRLLVAAGADLDARGGVFEFTPLHMAARYGRTEIARLLIEAGADPTAFARTGFTPLHVAVDHDHEEFVRLLIETGVDPDAHDSASGFTPLALARIRQHFDIWWFLREAAAALDRKRTHLD